MNVLHPHVIAGFLGLLILNPFRPETAALRARDTACLLRRTSLRLARPNSLIPGRATRKPGIQLRTVRVREILRRKRALLAALF